MATAITTTTGHVARALRFYNLPEIVVGIAVTEPWPNEAVPPAVDGSAFNLGRIYNKTYSGASFSSLNSNAIFNSAPFRGGSIGYKIIALTANTYEVRKLSDNTLVGNPSYTAQAGARSDIITGLDITVTNTSMTAGHFFSFYVDGPISYQVITQKQLVVPDPAGTIEYRDQNWRIVSPSNAIKEGARFVFLEVIFRYDEHPLTDFRQLGIFTGLTREVGVASNKANLLPSEVADCGYLELVDNHGVVTRDLNQREKFQFILEH